MIEYSLDLLKTFFEVAKQKNISTASQNLFVSQSAVSQSINKLEQALGVGLFNRSKRGVTLTYVGEQIFEKTKNILAEIKSIEEIALNAQNIQLGRILIGCGGNNAKKVLKEPIIQMHNHYPNVEILIFDEPQQKMFEKLKIGDLDLVISQKNSEKVGEFDFVELFKERFVFVTTKAYLEKEKEKDTYIVLGEGTFNRKVFNQFLKTTKIKNTIVQVSGYNFAVDLCLNDMGIALVPNYIVEPYLKSNELLFKDDFDFEGLEYGYYTNKGNISMLAKKFLKFVK